MPFGDGTISLVVSRGSLRFWRNKPLAIREINRVLEPKGKCYIGGGLGSPELAEQISQQMAANGIMGWKNKPQTKNKKDNSISWKAILEKVGIKRYKIIDNDSGHWICFEKEE